ncbi:target of SBF [Rhizina undulata]
MNSICKTASTESPSTPKPLDASTTVSGKKRPALLPPFEYSPRVKRLKSKSTTSSEKSEKRTRYLTPPPLPSSSVSFGSSPPRLPRSRRPLLERSLSSFSDRAPLSALPSIVLPENGDPILLGRSSISCQYQLSASRRISRVHVKVRYVDSAFSPRIELECLGSNGIKVHCQGNSWQLERGETFASETEDADIMLDIQQTRVLIPWPQITASATESDSGEDTPLPGVSRSPSVELVDENEENVDPKTAGIRLSRSKRDSGNPMILPYGSGFPTDTLLEIYEDGR